jgi:hypothetical protein
MEAFYEYLYSIYVNSHLRLSGQIYFSVLDLYCALFVTSLIHSTRERLLSLALLMWPPTLSLRALGALYRIVRYPSVSASSMAVRRRE